MRPMIAALLAPLALAAGACVVDVPDLGGFEFRCQGPTDCGEGRPCVDGRCQPPGPDARADGLVAHLPLDDLVGGASPDALGVHPGRCVGPACPAPTDGVAGGALAFGGDDLLEIVHHPRFDGAAGTVSVWLSLPAVPPEGTTMMVIGRALGDVYDNSWELYVEDTGELMVTAFPARFAASTLLPLATWVHLALTWDGETIALYLDGDPAGSAVGPLSFDDHSILLGADVDLGGLTAFLVGSLDDLRLHDRALAAAEIASLAAR